MNLESVWPLPPGRSTMSEEPLPTAGTHVQCSRVEPCVGRWTTEDCRDPGRPEALEYDDTIRLESRT